MAEPLITVPNPAGQGRPIIAEEQYKLWLEELRPYLENSSSLWYSCGMAGLEPKYDTIMEKYKRKDWFSKKVDAYRQKPGDLVNDIYVRVVRSVNDKIKQGQTPSDQEVKMLDTFAKAHRTAQGFFVNRVENKTVDDDNDNVGKVLDTIDSNYDDVAAQATNEINKPANEAGSPAQEQVVEAQPPVQNQGQTGELNNIPTQPDPTETPIGTGEPPIQ